MRRAIVLKHNAPYKNTCVLFDSALGRITGVVMHAYMSAGTVLEYTLVQKKNWYVFEQVECIHVPLLLARNDLLFLHYVIEMCYHFIPEGVCPERVYDVLLRIVQYPVLSGEQKKRVLCVLLALLELYPEDAVQASARIYALSQLPLEQVFEEKIDLKIEKNITRWLYQSVEVHMGAQHFKTIHFLDEII